MHYQCESWIGCLFLRKTTVIPISRFSRFYPSASLVPPKISRCMTIYRYPIFCFTRSSMHLTEAIDLIQHEGIRGDKPTTWADLGCGSGLFTRALASLQLPGSLIYAVDTHPTLPLNSGGFSEIRIETVPLDFVRADWPFAQLDGLLMANSLHYVSNQLAFLAKAIRHLTESGVFLVVEYDSDVPNPWVPYPLSYHALKRLFSNSGYSRIEKVNQKPSRYGRANLYAALISR